MTTDTELELPSNLRVADIIAKTARVTLKDTLRVLAALDAVSYLYDIGPEELLEIVPYDYHRPTPEQVAACEQSFYALREASGMEGDHPSASILADRLHLIRSLV